MANARKKVQVQPTDGVSFKDSLAAQAEASRGRVRASTDKKAGVLRLLATGRGDQFTVNPYLIQVKPDFNFRDFSLPENIEHVNTLARSIAETGVKNPLVVNVEGEEVFLVDGECRLRATLIALDSGAEIPTVPVIVEQRYSSEADRVFGQIVRNSGKNLTSFEMGATFKKLIDLGWTERNIADKAGKSIGHVTQLLEMNAAPAAVRALVSDGSVAFTLAWQTYKENDGDATKTMEALTTGLTVAEAAGKTKVTKKHLAAAAPKPKAAPAPKKKTPTETTAKLLRIFTEASVTEEHGTVTVTMSAEAYATVKDTIGL